MTTVAAVVEGDGEVRAFQPLVRRVAYAHGIYDLEVVTPFRLPRAKFGDPVALGRAIELQARRVRGAGGVLVLLDADDDCAVDLARRLKASHVSERRYAVVAAVREFESVLLAAYGVRPVDAESKRDAKGELRRLLGEYRETVHQAKLSAVLDLELARGCRWFRKLEKELVGILRG